MPFYFSKSIPKTPSFWYNNKSESFGGDGMTFSEICECLKNAGIENYDGEARILTEQFSRAPLSLDSDYMQSELLEAVQKRISGYPLQYILGKWWLARCEFFVNEACLIPRPDTECVIEEAVRLLPRGAHFVDLCTGSGCIAVSILDLRRDTSADAYELYPETLKLAVKNAEHNGVGDRFCGILGDVMDKDLLDGKKYEAIISNPPYIRSEIVPTLSKEVHFEPAAALDGGLDGLDFYRAIVSNFKGNLAEHGVFIFEIGYDQAEDITDIAERCGFACRILKDLGGNDRVAVLSIPDISAT